MFGYVIAVFRRWYERYARWEVGWHLNHHLARRLGDPKGTKYVWQLHGNADLPHVASWSALLWAEDPGKLIAYTQVPFGRHYVLVGAFFDYGDMVSHELPPVMIINTEVLSRLPQSASEWERDPALFDNRQSFNEKAVCC